MMHGILNIKQKKILVHLLVLIISESVSYVFHQNTLLLKFKMLLFFSHRIVFHYSITANHCRALARKLTSDRRLLITTVTAGQDKGPVSG
jgi:hypothetical protein